MLGVSSSLDSSVLNYLRKDVAKLSMQLTVQQALTEIRHNGIGERIVYFYAVDDDDRLMGVVPTRRLLTAPLTLHISDIMISPVVSIPHHATLLESVEYFTRYKFLSFPVTDEFGRLLGAVDISIFVENAIDVSDRDRMHSIFEVIGFHIQQLREASPLKAFQFRLPWLFATITSGTACAALVGFFEVTLAKSLILAFFLALVLGLGESVSIQSMTLTIHSLRSKQPEWKWYTQTLFKELGSAALLGVSCGTIVSLIAWTWRGEASAAIVIGFSILFTLCCSVFWGLSIPSLLHKLNLDMRIAAGPLTLALTDISTVFIYFYLARSML